MKRSDITPNSRAADNKRLAQLPNQSLLNLLFLPRIFYFSGVLTFPKSATSLSGGAMSESNSILIKQLYKYSLRGWIFNAISNSKFAS
jgi:hypothetical protein